MIYLLAGHSNRDPGASGRRFQIERTSYFPYMKTDVVTVHEATLTMALRDLVVEKIQLQQFQDRNASVTTDDDNDSLKQVLKKIKSTESDTICDLHFNSGSEKATGIAVIHPEKPTDKELQLATDLASQLSAIMGIRNRGTMKPSETPRKKLGVMAPKGTNVLIEVCFITNVFDVALYDIHRDKVALTIADLLTLSDSSESKQ